MAINPKLTNIVSSMKEFQSLERSFLRSGETKTLVRLCDRLKQWF